MAYRENAKPADRPPSFLARIGRAYVNKYLDLAVLPSLILGSVLLLAPFWIVRTPAEFSQQYVQPLRAAILATDPEVMLLNLQRAIRYAEMSGFADGNTTRPPRPEGDLLAWHRTLIAATADVATLTPTTPIEERRQVLARVRARLATAEYEPRLPQDIDAFPHHRLKKALYIGALAAFAATIAQLVVWCRRQKAASQS